MPKQQRPDVERDRFYTVRQAAEKLQLSPKTVDRLCNDGSLGSTKTASGSRRVSTSDLNAYLYPTKK